MRRIKTTKTFLLSRCYGPPSDQHLVVGCGMAFGLDGGGLMEETALWKALPEELPAPVILDHGFPKPAGEVLVAGSAMALEGSAVSAMKVEFSVGSVRRQLAVFGDRTWQSKAGLVVFSEPQPFQSLKLSPAYAFGGETFVENAVGVGHRAADLLAMGFSPPLPNIERADALIRHIDDAPAPAIIGPVDLMAPSRQRLAGTYDAAWLAKRRPGLPDDADARIFHAAQPEQRLANGYFNGDEEVEIAGMHAGHKHLRGALPGLRARAFARVRLPDDVRPVFREIALRCDTVWLLGSALIGATIWRGSLPAHEAEAADVETLMLAAEHLDGPLLSLEHYQEQMRLRSEKATAALYALRSSGLTPAPTPEQLEHRAAARVRAREAMQAQRERTVAYFLDQAVAKLDPAIAPFVPPIAPGPLPDDYPIVTPEDIQAGDVDLEAIVKFADKQVAAARALTASRDGAKAMLAAMAALARGETPDRQGVPDIEIVDAFAQGLQALDKARVEPDSRIPAAIRGRAPDDPAATIRATIAEKLGRIGQEQTEYGENWPEARARALGLQSGLPEDLMQQAENAIAQAAAATSATPGEEKLAAANPAAAAERRARMERPPDRDAAARAVAKLLTDGPPVPPGATKEARASAEAARTKMMEKLGKASAASPGQSPLQEMIASAMAGAPAETASLAQMPELASRHLAEADAAIRAARVKINSARRIMPKATMPQKPLHEDVALKLGELAASEHSAGRSLSGLDFAGARAVLARFSGADAQESFWERAVLMRSDWTSALLAKAVFAEADLSAAIFVGANLRSANLSGANLSGADLSKADLHGALLGESDLSGATLDGAVLGATTVMKAKLAHASLRGARIEQTTFLDCDLSGADLREARFERCIFIRSQLNEARAAGATLIRCAFTKVDARGIDLSGAWMERVAAVGDNDFSEALFVDASAVGTTWMKTKLGGADLSGANFSEATMQEAALSGARLRRAVLRRAMLGKADFQDADLEAADLFTANLRGADLSRSNLRGANLYAADMEGATLRIADLTDANLHTTLFELASHDD